jgi:hypothetical protein
MKVRLPGRRRAAEAGRAKDGRSGPEPAPVTWARAQLREQIQREGAALAPNTQLANRQTRQIDRSPLGDMEGRIVTTTGGNITKDMTPLEAANLLEKLEGGHQAAWLSTREVPWQSAEYQSRFQNAAEVDDVFRDVMWETVENGMRRPGEPVEEFAERAESEASLADTHKASAEPPAAPIIRSSAAMVPVRAGDSQDEIVARLLNDVSSPEGQAYARAFSDNAATYVRGLRERDPLPEPDRTPGVPHPDPFLAGRGWHVNKHGIYTRRAEPAPKAPQKRELEAEL